MKKILLVLAGIYPNIGGGEIYSDNLIKMLIKNGHHVDIYVCIPLSKEHILAAREMYENISINFIKEEKLNIISSFLKKINWAYCNKHSKKYLKNLDLNKYDFILDNTVFNFKELRKNNKAFFIAHTTLENMNNEWKPKKTKNLFLFVYRYLIYVLMIRPMKLSLAYKSYENIVVASEQAKNDMEETKKLLNSKVFLIPNGVSNKYFNDNYNPNNEVVSILRFDNKTKNLVFLNELSANLNNKINIYGFGKDQHMLKNVIMHGKISTRKEIFEILHLWGWKR